MTEQIENNNIHLTQMEKLNLNNLGVSVKLYGATGDGIADDTSAFTKALEENHRVYVPEGTYKITGELIIAENCELKLAQDAVLNFYPLYLKEVTNDETGEKHVVVIPYEQFHCITLETASSLVGNHATVNVPYTFKGSVLYVSADPEDNKADNGSVDSIKGFRYLKDINIIKIFELNNDDINLDGTAVSWNKETGGTGLLIEKSNAYPEVSGLCGLDFSDLRITGAFDYGIRCINTDTEASWKKAWNYDTHIDAVIDGCRTGVYMYHYSNARVSALIKLRCAYDPETVKANLKYAEHGIHLVNSINIDLSSSRIEDWGLRNGNPSISNEYNHIKLDGSCPGLMIDNSLCSEIDNSNVREYIHTTTPENFDNMTILGESNADYFNCERDSAIGIIFPNYRVGTSDTLVPDNDRTASGFIPCEKDLTIYLKAISFELDDLEDVTYNRIVVYNENKNKIYAINGKYFNSNKYFDYKYTSDSNTTEIKIKNTDVKYIRFCCNSTGITYDSSVKVYDKIFMCKDGYLKDRIYIKTEYIKGLEENLQQLSNRITALENSVKD